jgi:hypothetical protein
MAQGPAVGIADGLGESASHRLDHAVGAADVDAEQVLDLGQSDGDGRRRGEPADDRVRQEVDQEAEAQQPGDDQQAADQ